MTQEEKSLLVKDLCARLPYRIYIKSYYNDYEDVIATGIDFSKELIGCLKDGEDCCFEIYYGFKPYLRPMSSMTEEESYDYYNTFEWEEDLNGGHYPNSKTEKTFDWLNKHHFDYRGLIEKGLALEAPKDMYNIKKK